MPDLRREPPANSPRHLCPHCLLNLGLADADPGTEEDPPLPPRPEGLGARPGHRLQISEEIARGGMGLIFRGKDEDLGREVAVKVLHVRFRDQPELVRRFVEEARVTGGLQHPGVVPVYQVGTLDDDRPYFAMRLVHGRTLAAILAERPAAGGDRPRLLSILLQVAQTLAFAHSRGVLHRDLTPSNVMVGEHGEVQLMDWGLARARPGDGLGIPGDPGPAMGTPGYMAPELILGGMAGSDERTDVFGLGSILCEILTGSPAYGPEAAREARDRATPVDLAGARARLESCGADRELADLALDCLTAEPAGRPRDAGEVETRMTAYLDGVRDRLRESELAAGRGAGIRRRGSDPAPPGDGPGRLARGAGGTGRRRRRPGLATSRGPVGASDGGPGRGRAAPGPGRRRPGGERTALAGGSRGDPAGPEWVGAGGRADQVAAGGPAEQVERGLAEAEADRRLVASLDVPRSLSVERNQDGAEVAYGAAFRQAGLDVNHGTRSTSGGPWQVDRPA